MNTKDIAYRCGDKQLTGYLADGSNGGTVPGIVLYHQGGGLTDYYASKPGHAATELFRKTAYARAFEPWKMVVITGVYMDDLDAQVNATIMTTIIYSLGLFFVAWNCLRHLNWR